MARKELPKYLWTISGLSFNKPTMNSNIRPLVRLNMHISGIVMTKCISYIRRKFTDKGRGDGIPVSIHADVFLRWYLTFNEPQWKLYHGKLVFSDNMTSILSLPFGEDVNHSGPDSLLFCHLWLVTSTRLDFPSYFPKAPIL